MGKLGKKARKFAKKKLQSVHKRNRKLNATFKRKPSSRDKKEATEDQVGAAAVLSTERQSEDVTIEDPSLDPKFSEDDSDSQVDSGSDGFLSEDSSGTFVTESETENDSESGRSAISEQNQKILLELAEQKRNLEGLMKKNPKFVKFLDSHKKDSQQFINEETYSDGEDETSDQDNIGSKKDPSNLNESKVLTASAIDFWCERILAQDYSAFPNLLNAYRAACHYGSDVGIDEVQCQRIQNSGTFCKIVMFVLREVDEIFRRLLGISGSNCKIETILELKNTSKWKTSKPFIKSYLRSTLFLMNQATDSEILVFTLIQLRASIIFFAAFPSLQRRLIEVSIHLWATGGGDVSLSSFLILRNISLLLGPACHETCLTRTYKAFIAHCNVESSNLKHLQYLIDSLVGLYSLDVPKSISKVFMSIQQLARILQLGLKTKKKEALKKIYNWQYTNCIDLWVKFISTNIKDHDMQPLLYLIIQVINGVAHLFPGPRYFPLRLKCIQMLNQLSSSSGVFIPIASLVLDCLEYIGSGKQNARPRRVFDVSSVLKVPKQWLKLQGFQEELVLSAIKLFSVHFSQWSLHISFPELATIPLIRLRKFHEKITTDSLRRPVKRLIDQVEQNVEFVQKKRDEAAFSPKDKESVESFLQLKTWINAPFTQYYASIIEKSLSGDLLKKRSSGMFMRCSTVKREVSRKQQHPNHEKSTTGVINKRRNSDKENVDSVMEGRLGKKQRV